MTKTNLAYIDEVANAAAETPRQPTHTISGFRFRADVEAVSDNAMAYARDREALKRKLGIMDVEPLAMVPTAWWDDVVKRSGLVRTTLDDGGRAGLSESDARRVSRVAHNIIALVTVLFVVGSVVGASYWAAAAGLTFVHPNGDPGTGVGMVFFAFFAALAACFVSCAGFISRPKFRLASWLALLFVEAPLSFGRDSPTSCDYTLPTPPAEAAATLLKLTRGAESNPWNDSRTERTFYLHEIGVVAERDAFALSATPVELLSAWREDERVRQAEIRRLREMDPIVFVTHGKATAIVVQYGDFPIEKEVVDAAIAVDL